MGHSGQVPPAVTDRSAAARERLVLSHGQKSRSTRASAPEHVRYRKPDGNLRFWPLQAFPQIWGRQSSARRHGGARPCRSRRRALGAFAYFRLHFPF